MRILVINGSPKGQYSTTLHTCLYLEKKFKEHTFKYIDAGKKVKSLERDFSPALEAIQEADVLLFCYPVYTFLAPYQLHKFIELMKESGADFSGKIATQVTTSKHFYDITAHSFIEENCADMDIRFLDGLSADMDDLLTEKGQRQATDWLAFTLWRIARNDFDNRKVQTARIDFDAPVGAEVSAGRSCEGREEAPGTAEAEAEAAPGTAEAEAEAAPGTTEAEAEAAPGTAEAGEAPRAAEAGEAPRAAEAEAAPRAAEAEAEAAPRATEAGEAPGTAEAGEAPRATEAGEALAGKKAVIVADLLPGDGELRAMIDKFIALLPCPCDIVNIREFPFKGGCVSCFNCSTSGKCIYADGFDEFLRGNIHRHDAIIYAFRIKDHSMGSRFKMYDDRQFCNGHRTVTMGTPFAYLVAGRYSAEPNLRLVLEARAQVGGNYLAGVAATEDDGEAVARLAARLSYAMEHRLCPPQNFLGVGGMKIFRDLIYQMRGMMRADHKFFKSHGQYDFPQKKWKTSLMMYPVGWLMGNRKLKAKMGSKMNEGMIAAYKKVVEKA